MDYSAIVLMIVAGGFGLVGKIVFDWLKNPRAQAPLSPSPKTTSISLKNGSQSEILAILKWLKEVHDRHDEDGVPRWYFPKALIKHAEENAKQTVLMVQHLKDIREYLKENQTILSRMAEK